MPSGLGCALCDLLGEEATKQLSLPADLWGEKAASSSSFGWGGEREKCLFVVGKTL